MREFKLGSFNLFNLVLPEVTYYGNKKYSQSDFDRKVKWIGNQLNSMNADIVGFQEIFHIDALKAAIENTKFSNENICALGETGESPIVGLASTFPIIDEPISISQIPQNIIDGLGSIATDINSFSRPILKAKLKISDEISATVFVCHLKSKRPTIYDNENADDLAVTAIGEARSLLRRSVEATGLRQLVLNETQENSNPVFLIGDLNDTTRSVTSSIISGPLPWKFDSAEVKKYHWDNLLYSSFDIMSLKSHKNEWPTHIYNGHYESLDHIYISQEFFFRNRNRLGNVDFVHVFDDHLKDDTLSRDRLPKWQSDHGQVVTSLSLL